MTRAKTRRRRGLGGLILYGLWRGRCRLPMWFRLPLVTLSAYFGAGWLYFEALWQSALILVGVGVLVYAGWVGRRIHRSTAVGMGRPPWRQLLTAPIVERRRIGTIRRQWVRLCLEVGWYYGDNDRPLGLRKLSATPSGDLVAHVAPGAVALKLEDVEKGAPRIAYTVGAREVVTRRTGPGRLRLTFYYTDPLHRALPIQELPFVNRPNWITYGVQQDGKPAGLLMNRPVLIGGDVGSGKSSMLWAMLADLLRRGVHLDLLVADLKGGVEMPIFEELFEAGGKAGLIRVLGYEQTAKGAEKLIAEGVKKLKIRQSYNKKVGRREHVISPEHPFTVLILDELLTLGKLFRAGTDGELGYYLSQGRAGYCTSWGTTQLGHASELGVVRNLFPQRRVFATPSDAVTDTILGSGATANGAQAHLLTEHDAGICYAKDEGTKQPVKVRVAYVSEDRYPAPNPDRMSDLKLIGQGRPPRGMLRQSGQWAVYRFYGRPDRAGARQLIYVGFTNDIDRRYGEHRNRSPWWSLVDQTAEPVWFQSETGARAGERKAIETEKPLYNDKHNRRNPFRVPRVRPALPELTARPEPYAEQIPAEAAVGGEVVEVEPSDMIDQEVTR